MGKNRRRHRKEAHVKAPSSPDSDAAPASPVDHEFDSAASSGKIVTDAKVVNSWSSLPWQTANDATLPEPSTKDKKGGGKKGKKRRRPIPEAEPSELDEESHCEEENRGEWGEEGDRDEYIDSYNHYDDPHADPSDLWNPIESQHTIGKKGWAAGIEGADDPGIMLGLEVIDGSKYEVQKEETDGGVVTKVFFKDGDANDNNGEGASADDADADAAASSGNGDDNDEAEMARLKAEMRKLKRREARLRKKKRKLAKRNAADEKGEDTEDKNDKDEKVVAKRGKKAKKNNTDKKSSKGESSTKDDSRQDRPTPEDVSAVRSSWLSPTGVYLHSTLCSSLASRSFRTPTPIQGATLAASVLGRRDVVGAAPTGSGKTLAYGLPVLHGILEGRDNAEEARAEAELARAEKDEAAQDESSSESESEVKSKERPLAALILVPTRELALQVTSEIQIACDKSVDVCAVVGGMAEALSRLLRRRPEVVVATPGRLWELMSKEEHPHLTDLSSLRYLIIDEAGSSHTSGILLSVLQDFRGNSSGEPTPSLPRRIGEEDARG
uniref:ATP-dependent RNA helicase n=1 Tax=Odontella aurita TaxID=265563 RepID=A0A7S4MIY5_9STRA|mmetsp:Transcript_23058/g.68010  ORF Transcript_23058/g.68010 Transcript_23058/m.68010 type:complete len:553 (+) Transcript_23058:2-1660(+)